MFHCWDYLSSEGRFICPISGIIFSRRRFFLFHFWDYFVPEGWFLVPLLGLFVSRRRVFCPFPRGGFCFITRTLCLPKEVFFCPIAGIFCLPKEVFLLHCWDCLSPKEGIFPSVFYLPKEVVFLKEQLFKSLKRSRNVKHWTWSH